MSEVRLVRIKRFCDMTSYTHKAEAPRSKGQCTPDIGRDSAMG